MLRLYDAGQTGAGCACCAVIFPDFEDQPPAPPPPKEHVALPDTLDCDACGKTLYRLLKN
jgi:hypothetical protein